MIALIPARGGSKGLPKKNIKNLCGKPMIAYTIEAALKAEHVSRVIVSTDDLEIASISKQFGAEIPFMRPKELATDTSTSLQVYEYTLDRLDKDVSKAISEFIVLQPTSPLRQSHHINEAIEMFYEKKADSVISYTEEDHPIVWHKYITPEGKFENIFNGDFIQNRQEIKKTFYPNGAIFVLKRDIIHKTNYYQKNSYAYIMDKYFSVDVDDLFDFDFAKFLLNKHVLT